MSEATGRAGEASGAQDFQRLAFLWLEELGEGVFRGGALVTDRRGAPVEFRCTSPVRPTSLQRTLYGGTLLTCMCVELTGRPLMKELSEQPDVVLVAQPGFVELRDYVDRPVLMATRQGSAGAEADANAEASRSVPLSSPSGRFAPVVVTCHWRHPEDLDVTLGGLGEAFARFDLTEPFARIKTALALIHEQDAAPEEP